MGGGSWGWLMAVLTAALVATAAAQGSGVFPTCVSKLASCAAYLNATKTPPQTCCSPLKEAVTKERPCLCSIYNNPAVLQSLNVNITQVLGLPKLCNINIGSKDPKALCKGVAQSPSASPTGSAQSPPTETGSASTSGSGSGSGGSNSATNMDKSTRTGLLASVLVFCAYVVFY